MSTENEQPGRDPKLYKQIGKWLLRLGAGGLVLTVAVDLFGSAWWCHQPINCRLDAGALPAISFLFLMLSIAFLFPDMLEDSSKMLSTMRVIVYMVVCVFVFIAIKLGWGASNFDDFHIDRTWVYILGLAFGSKVFQSFSEGMDGEGKGKDDGG